MPTLKTAPTPKQFANAWTRGFAKAVRDAAGRDGRLSRNEAAKIADMPPALAKYADNAMNYLERTGQKTVGVEKLIGKGHDYAFAVADKVAGKGNRISLVEARNLPDDISGDFLAMRGKGEPAKLTGSKLSAAINTAGKDAWFISEGDSEATAIRAANPNNEAIDGKFVMNNFKAELDNMFWDDDEDLATKVDSAAESKKFLSDIVTDYADPDLGDYYHESGEAFGRVQKVLEANLTDMRLVTVGPSAPDGSLQEDSGTYGLFLVGKDANGDVAGIVLEAAWT